MLQLPECQPVSPVTGGNWEGGIAPDMPAERDHALTVAYNHALTRITATDLPDWLRDEASTQLNAPPPAPQHVE